MISTFAMINPLYRAFLSQLGHVVVERMTGGAGARRAGFPCDVGDITVGWLDTALAARYPGTRAASVDTSLFGEDMGNSSRMVRLTLDYAQNPHSLPGQMVLKMSKAETGSRVAFAAPRMLEMEARFFETLEPELRPDERLAEHLTFPRSFAARYRNEGGNFYVLMEDLALRNGGAGVRFRHETQPYTTMEEAEVAVRALAAFHARYWGSARLTGDGDLSWIIHQRSGLLSANVRFMGFSWKKFVGRLAHRLPPDVLARGDLLVPVSQRVHDAMAAGGSFGGYGDGEGAPDTVVHGDFHLENAFFHPDEGAEVRGPMGIYDLQMMRVGKGAIDLACLIAGSVDVERLGSLTTERSLVETYVTAVNEGLAAGAGGDASREYGFDAAWHDYKLGVALHFVWNVSAAVALPFDTEAHLDYDEYATRLCKALDRTDGINYALGVLGDLVDTEGRSPTPPWGAPPRVPALHRRADGESPGRADGVVFHDPRFTRRPTGSLGRLKYEAKHAFFRRMVEKSGHHGQKMTIEPRVLEESHSMDWAEGTPGEDAAFDSYYLSAFSDDCDAAPDFALRWGRRLKPEAGEVWCVIRVPGEGLLVWGDGGDALPHPNTSCHVVSDGPGAVVAQAPGATSTLRLDLVEPMRRWTSSFRGTLLNRTRGVNVPVEFDLEWTALSPDFSFGSDLDSGLTAAALAAEPASKGFFDELKASHQEHFEQFGAITGTLKVAGKSYVVRARGMRDRAWGARDWGYMQAYSSNYFRFADRHLNFTFASLPTITNHRSGFVHIPASASTSTSTSTPSPENVVRGLGTCEPITHVSADFWDLLGPAPTAPPGDFTVAVRAGGVVYTIRVTVADGNTVGFQLGSGAMYVNFRFARFEVAWVDPVTKEPRTADGAGVSEFGYRVAGYQPYRFEGATARPALMAVESGSP